MNECTVGPVGLYDFGVVSGSFHCYIGSMANPQSGLEPAFTSPPRVEVMYAAVSRSRNYDSDWRELPCALIAEFRPGPVMLERRGQPPSTIASGSAVVIPAGLAHRFVYPVGQTTYTRWTHLRCTLPGNDNLLESFEIPAVIAPPVSAQLGALCEELTGEGVVWPSHAELPGWFRQQSLALQLLTAVSSVAVYRPAQKSVEVVMARMQPVLCHIEDHLAESLGRPFLASLAGVTPGYFDALFKQAVGSTPQSYIKQLRIRRAQELLIHTDFPVQRIAAAVGFNDAFHFTRQFQAESQSSPTAYRQALRVALFAPSHGDPEEEVAV